MINGKNYRFLNILQQYIITIDYLNLYFRNENVVLLCISYY